MSLKNDAPTAPANFVRDKSDRTVFFTTKEGGQVGLSPFNVKYLCTDYVLTMKNVRYDLDPSKWVEHQKALVNGCL